MSLQFAIYARTRPNRPKRQSERENIEAAMLGLRRVKLAIIRRGAKFDSPTHPPADPSAMFSIGRMVGEWHGERSTVSRPPNSHEVTERSCGIGGAWPKTPIRRVPTFGEGWPQRDVPRENRWPYRAGTQCALVPSGTVAGSGFDRGAPPRALDRVFGTAGNAKFVNKLPRQELCQTHSARGLTHRDG